MSFVDILFIFVIIILVAAGIIYYLRTQRKKEVDELQARKEEMMNVSIADQLFTLKNMELSGQTKRQYESLVATWQTITNFKFTEIESALVGAEQYTEQMNLVRAKATLDEAREILDETEAQVAELHDDLSKLLDVNTENHERSEELLERYNEARKSIMNHSFDYGPAIETLEKNIQYLELNFTRYNELTANGDHLEAQDMLNSLSSDLDSLEDILKRLPAMYDQIKNEFEALVQDLRDGYDRMVKANFKFDTDNIPEQIDQVQEKLNEAKAAIKNADLANAQTLMDKSDREIESLYDLMEAEVEAKHEVGKQMKDLANQLNIVKENNRYAGIEVDRIAQSYLLHENEVDQVAEFAQQIEEEEGKYQAHHQSLEANQAIYSEVETDLRKSQKRLNELDEKQKNLVKSLGQLSVREKEAKSNLDLYELDMRNMKRRLEKQHLPGLNQSYYDLFYKVTDQIEDLSKQLNHVRIDMNEIHAMEEDIENHLSQLDELTEEILDNATLTEYMIQHSNRFRYDYPEMDQAIQETEYLFYDQYCYRDALSVIEKALYRVDQEGPTQVRRMYRHEKENRIY